MSADFTPEKEDYKILTPFKMQVLTNFPYIEADFDALTNYQLLCKIVEYLNGVITNENEVTEQVTSLYNAYVSLQDYVNKYFENLDLQDEINIKLDNMVQDGTLTALIGNYCQPYIDEQNIRIENIENKVDAVASGTPIPVSSVNDMTDTTKLYLLLTDGYWYYYDTTNTEWVAGGVYQTAENSDTVTYIQNKLDDLIESGTFNLVNTVEWEGGGLNPTYGNKTTSPATAKRTKNFIEIPFETLHMKKASTGFAFYLCRYDKTTHDFISCDTLGSSKLEATITLDPNQVYMLCYSQNGATEPTPLSTLTLEPHRTIFDKMMQITPPQNKAIITFIDDDESINFYNNNKAIFDSHNMKCDIAVVTDWVGENNRMSLEQLQELKTQGFEIVSHSKTHDSKWQTPNTSTIESLKEDAQISYNYMANNNFNTNIFVYPFGSGTNWNTTGKHRVAKIINQVGFNYGVRSVGNDGKNDSPLNNLMMNRLFIDKANNLSTYTDIIDDVVTNKSWVIFGTHSGNTSQIDANYLDDLLDYIDSLNSVDTVVEVMTFTQALAYKRNVLSKGVYEFEDYTYIDKDGKFYY